MSGRLAALRGSDPQSLALGAVAAVSVLALLAALSSLVPELYLNPDIASAPVIGSLMAHAPAGSVVTLGNYPWYEPLWLMEATRSLPAHRQIWEAIPIVGSLLAIALVVWAARRALGGWAALVTAAILLSTTGATRFVLLTPSAHWPNVLHVAVLAAVLVYLNGRRARLPTGTLVAGGVALTIFTAAGATDTLFLVDGLLPFVVTALVGWWRTRHPVQRRIAVFSLAVGLGGLIGGLLLRALMRHDHVIPTPFFHPAFIASGSVGRNIETLLESFVAAGGGNFFGSAFHMLSVLAFVAAVLTFVAGVKVVLGCWRAAPSLGRHVARVTPRSAAREAWLVFWGTTILVTCVAFVVTNLPDGVPSSRYLMTVYFGVASLLPWLVGRAARARTAVTAAVAAFAVIAVITLASEGRDAYGTPLSSSDIAAFTSYAERSGLTVGYADYATAPALTYATGMKVDAFPVAPCGSTLCPFYLNTISSWYAPRPDTSSFLIVDAATQNSYLPVTKPPAAFGSPAATEQFGDLTVYVYRRDIASDFGA
ncbi:MAG: hypothetical protein ACRDLM_11155 [Gaiellaceae bacterium]